MNTGLTINIGWEYFLGIIAALIGIAWYTGSRFAKLETVAEWLKEKLGELKVDLDNAKTKAFQQNSPIQLTEKGIALLGDSGMKAYVDEKSSYLLEICKSEKQTKNLKTAYDIQAFVFDMFDKLVFSEEVDKKFKEFAYKQGVSIELIRRIGAIYFRDKAIEGCDFKMADLA